MFVREGSCMNELMYIFGQASGPQSFDQIRISIASPERIRSWSYGEIKKPETINYRTFKPERDGLFCARIFGPIKDYECLCGKYKRMKYRGIICEKCGVEVTLSKVRRDRMGHIELASPVAHIWFLKSLPSRIGLLLDMTLKDLEKVLYFESYVVIEPGLTPLKLHQLLNEEEYLKAQDDYGDDQFTAAIGAEAMRTMLSAIDLVDEKARLREELRDTTSEARRKKLVKRLKLIEAFIDSNSRPEWMILEVVPVIPPELRPLVPLDGGRFATSDLNDLYRRVINRNNRLKRLMELRAPDIIVRNEKRMLQEAVDALFDNGRRGRTITGANKRPLKSLSDMLKGKQGRFRQNLLGKRVDYSGRSVIVTGPELKLHQCGLPKKMALELFKPFIYSRLEAQLEARVLMMSTNNILSPANGKPIIVPSQDMVLGLYYLSIEKEGEPGEGMMLSDMAEVHQALAAGAVTLHTKIVSRVPQTDEEGNTYMKRFETTAGRMLLAETLPKSHKVPFETVNRLLTKKEIGDVIDIVYRHTGQKETVLFADAIMALGFRNAFTAGISFGKDDMVIPAAKEGLVDETRALVKDYEQQYQDGLITQQEKYNKVIDAWSRCGDQVASAMMKEISATPRRPDGRQADLNSIYMMAHSGARGSQAQIKQLAGMRGLMAKPSGEIIETPIISNFKEGLTVLEYFNSTHGARKGLADTALKTANSGYLTRRLVDVSQDAVIIEEDCGTDQALEMRAIVQGGAMIASLADRVLGRTTAEDIVDPKSGEVIIAEGELLDEPMVARIEEIGLQGVKIRSPLVCASRQGVCAKCYGRDLARGTPVNIGEAVGVIAAQSIGEPGTQLTMRTFHIGGAAQLNEQSNLEAPVDGTIELRDMPTIVDPRGRHLSLSRSGEIAILDMDGRELSTHRVPYGAHLLCESGHIVSRGDRIAEWDPSFSPVITEKAGTVKYQDLIENRTMTEVVDESTGITQRVVTDDTAKSKKESLHPRLTLTGAKAKEAGVYRLAPGAIVAIEDGQQVETGEVLARMPREAARTRDITGGLPRVAELFEARKPKENAIIAKVSGKVTFMRDYKAKRKIAIVPDDGSEPVEYLVPKSKMIEVQEGDYVKRGDNLVGGSPDPHDILEVLGVVALAEYLVSEIQEVYRLQGVKINDKHIEVIVRQMLQKVEITDSGDTTLLPGEQVDREEMDEINARLEKKQQNAEGTPVMRADAKARQQTQSYYYDDRYHNATG